MVFSSALEGGRQTPGQCGGKDQMSLSSVMLSVVT
jgi:hypothetical protein